MGLVKNFERVERLSMADGLKPIVLHDPDEEHYCKICGADMEWVDCWECGGEGGFDEYDFDPINVSPLEEIHICQICHGEGGYLQCSALPHSPALLAELHEDD